LSEKLGLEPGMRVHVAEAPADYWDIAEFDRDAVEHVMPEQNLDFAHTFVTRRKDLAAWLTRLTPLLKPTGMLWVSWPKKSSGVETDITEDVVRAEALPLGLVDTKVFAVDETWSGLKLVWRKENR
jgi:hypothetical protein